MTQAAIIPLFEKLIDENSEEPFEKNPKRFHTLKESQNSILQDLSRLLNTRVASFIKDYPDKIPYSYGINVTAPTSAESVFEIQELESRINGVIKQFEPRLINANAKVTGVGNDSSVVFVNIDATAIIENRKIPLSFPIVVDV
ncbi:MAG: type VI secretion system baseplate subunit TssE [Holosporaceae bacterium]|jgi:type VI secretion system lysozyme-like protein|nr:type VI secretion system baseplate subunit TssE [Holosporaceae bacterium]